MKFDLKSMLVGAAIGGTAISVAVAGQVAVPHTFVAGTTARASEVNANFDALVQASNAQDTEISAIKSQLSAQAATEQMLCKMDDRPKWITNRTGLGYLSAGDFPFPLLVIGQGDPDNIRAVIPGPALCVLTSNPGAVIETNLQQLTTDGWRLSGFESTFYVFNR